jgi:hypothetical protein
VVSADINKYSNQGPCSKTRIQRKKMDLSKITTALRKAVWTQEYYGGYETRLGDYRIIVRWSNAIESQPGAEHRPVVMVLDPETQEPIETLSGDPDILPVFEMAERSFKLAKEEEKLRKKEEFDRFLDCKLQEEAEDVAFSITLDDSGCEDNSSDSDHKRSWVSRLGLGR